MAIKNRKIDPAEMKAWEAKAGVDKLIHPGGSNEGGSMNPSGRGESSSEYEIALQKKESGDTTQFAPSFNKRANKATLANMGSLTNAEHGKVYEDHHTKMGIPNFPKWSELTEGSKAAWQKSHAGLRAIAAATREKAANPPVKSATAQSTEKNREKNALTRAAFPSPGAERIFKNKGILLTGKKIEPGGAGDETPDIRNTFGNRDDTAATAINNIEGRKPTRQEVTMDAARTDTFNKPEFRAVMGKNDPTPELSVKSAQHGAVPFAASNDFSHHDTLDALVRSTVDTHKRELDAAGADSGLHSQHPVAVAARTALEQNAASAKAHSLGMKPEAAAHFQRASLAMGQLVAAAKGNAANKGVTSSIGAEQTKAMGANLVSYKQKIGA